MKTFLIYKLTNTHTGLSYIGYTNNLKRRIYDHKRDNTLGCQDFTTEILLDGITEIAEALEQEKAFIALHSTFENGYNKTTGGGKGTELSDKTLKKISDNSKKMWKNPEYRERKSAAWRGNNNPMKNPEIRKKVSESHKGKKRSNEARLRMSESHKGKTLSAEHKQNIGLSLTGNTLSETTRKKLSEAKTGVNNPMKRKEVLLKNINTQVFNHHGMPYQTLISHVEFYLNFGMSNKAIAKIFGVSPSLVCKWKKRIRGVDKLR